MKRVVVLGVLALLAIGCGGDDGSGDEQSSSSSASASEVDETTTTEVDETTTTEEPTTTTTEPEVAPLPANANPAVAVEGGVEFGPGTAGELTVVAQAASLDRTGSLPVVVRNMTDEPLAAIEATGTARDGAGGLVASGQSQGFQPFVVGPGEIAFGYVYFTTDGVPDGSTFEIAVTGDDPDDLFAGSIDLTVVEYNRTADSVIGVLRNDSSSPVSGPISVDMLCVDAANVPLESRRDYAEPDEAAPGATVSFSVDFFGDPPCDRFLLGGNGFDFG